MLDNFYRRFQVGEGSLLDMIHDCIAHLETIIATPEDRSFEDARKDVFLAVRPLRFDEALGERPPWGQLAFAWPVLPDLAAYCVIDRGTTFRYVSRSKLDSWNVTAAEVTKVAWENTVAENEPINVATFADDGGILIGSRSRWESIAHLLYWPDALADLVDSVIPGLLSHVALLTVPAPDLLVVATEICDPVVRLIQRNALRRHGRLLSKRVYLLEDKRIAGEAVAGTDGDIKRLPIEDWDAGSAAASERPYTPVA
jgi:hypothetical protein